VACHLALVAGATRKKAGFTLVELSIVLVIIGLLVGGVMVGRDLIKASEIRAQISQIEQFKTATNTFKVKYGYLPGDIPPSQTAQLGFFTFTGALAGKSYLDDYGPPWGYAKYGYGNNSGDIEYGENYVFWQHLSEAKMIAGQYGGSPSGENYLQSSTASIATAGRPVNATDLSGYDLFDPLSKLSHKNKHIDVVPNIPFTSLPYFTGTGLPNIFKFLATPSQEYAIDSKADDGYPDKGAVRENSLALGEVGLATCVTNASPNAYNLNPATINTTDRCAIAILW
jgi:prepilin-type N-terminal cleavage/methylation domain-containing protein